MLRQDRPMPTAIESYEREHERVIALDGVAFMLGLRSYVGFLEDETDLKELTDGLTTKADDLVANYVRDLSEVLEEATTLRDELPRLVPETDDSQMQEPADDREHWRYERSLATFDRRARQPNSVAYPPLPSDSVTDGDVIGCIGILRDKVRVARWGDQPHADAAVDLRPDLDDLLVHHAW